MKQLNFSKFLVGILLMLVCFTATSVNSDAQVYSSSSNLMVLPSMRLDEASQPVDLYTVDGIYDIYTVYDYGSSGVITNSNATKQIDFQRNYPGNIQFTITNTPLFNNQTGNNASNRDVFTNSNTYIYQEDCGILYRDVSRDAGSSIIQTNILQYLQK